MNVPISVLVGVFGLFLSALSFMLGQKKSNKDDGQKMGEFMGELRADRRNMQEDIKEIKKNIKEIKDDRLGIDDAISRAITEHERVFHNKG